MQFVDSIFNTPCHVSLDGRFDVFDICDDWPDAALLHAVVGASAHAAAQQRFAIGNGLSHTEMAVMGGGAKAVRLAGLFPFSWGSF